MTNAGNPMDRRAVLAGVAGLVLASPSPARPVEGGSVQAGATVFRPERFGARGDGASDDTAAFQALGRAVSERGGGTVALRPGATYRLGRQIRGRTGDPVFMPETMFVVTGVRGLIVEGNGATLKLNDGLHYGSFDPVTAKRFDPPAGRFTDIRYGAHVGGMLEVRDSTGIRIRNLMLDGNADRLVMGGRWDDRGIQLHADGLRLLDVTDVTVEAVTTRHHGRDGVYLRGRTRRAAGQGEDAIRFRGLRCSRNGRQGVSVVGGSGIGFINCLFADTGQGAITSAPAAGVDVEPNGRDWASALSFAACEFHNNHGVGLLAAQGASCGIAVRDCTFWAGFAAGAEGKGSGDAFWLTRPAVTIDNCRVHGNVTNLAADATVRGSQFDDDALPGLGQAAQRRRYLLAGAQGLFEDCSFTVTATGAHALIHATKPVTFRRCRMRHAGQALPTDLAAAFFGPAVTLEDVRFTEALRRPSPAGHYIAGNGAILRGTVTVGGPHIRWGGKKGPVGTITGS